MLKINLYKQKMKKYTSIMNNNKRKRKYFKYRKLLQSVKRLKSKNLINLLNKEVWKLKIAPGT